MLRLLRSLILHTLHVCGKTLLVKIHKTVESRPRLMVHVIPCIAYVSLNNFFPGERESLHGSEVANQQKTDFSIPEINDFPLFAAVPNNFTALCLLFGKSWCLKTVSSLPNLRFLP